MTETVKHTPGPWQIEFGHTQTASGIQYWQVTDGADAICCNQFCYTGDAEVNARLIAAAPDLLEALVMVRDADNDCHSDGLDTIPPMARAKIDAAIARAEGRS